MAEFPSAFRFRKYAVVFSFLCVLSIASVQIVVAQTLPECSLSKTNKNCSLTIDRSNPVAPSTVQMYSDQQLTVIIKNPLPFERYFLDFSTGQATVAPDVTSNIVTALTGNLGKLSNVFQSHEYVAAVRMAKARPANALDACYSKNFQDKQWPASTHVVTEKPDFDTCFGALAGYAIATYRDLEPLVAPDALTSGPLTSRTISYFTTQADLQDRIKTYVAAETAISNSIMTLAKPTATPPPAYTSDEQTYIAELGVYQKIIDAVSTDLVGYDQRIKDLGSCGYEDPNAGVSKSPFCWDKTSQTYSQGNLAVWKDKYYIRTDKKSCSANALGNGCAEPDKDPTVWTPGNGFDENTAYKAGDSVAYNAAWWTCVSGCAAAPQPKAPLWTESIIGQGQSLSSITIQSRTDDGSVYQNMVTRTITYSLDMLNLVSYSQEAAATSTNKKALASIAINFADEPTGKFPGRPLTALRWEASAGVFFSWLPSRTFTLTQPPNACRVSTGTPPVYDCTTRPTPVPFAAANYRLTGDLGGRWKQNIYMTGAVGVNPVSTTAEFGVGPSYAWRALMVSALCHIGHDTKWSSTMPNSNGDLPTYNHWTVKAAVGISVRVPSLTGR